MIGLLFLASPLPYLLVSNDDIRCLLVVSVIYNYWGIPSGHGVVLTPPLAMSVISEWQKSAQ